LAASGACFTASALGCIIMRHGGYPDPAPIMAVITFSLTRVLIIL
jgi:hypothetical protein